MEALGPLLLFVNGIGALGIASLPSNKFAGLELNPTIRIALSFWGFAMVIFAIHLSFTAMWPKG